MHFEFLIDDIKKIILFSIGNTNPKFMRSNIIAWLQLFNPEILK